ncbi:Sterol 3-beta-glucosyltransferase [Serendipita sp. 399]|nr:Sterol 3-beta-glucosyltransferase [Serendipita sp. 399]
MDNSASPPRPSLQNPLSGTTIDTDPSTLGLSLDDGGSGSSTSVVERIKQKSSQIRKSGHRKLNSLSRRNRNPQNEDEQLGQPSEDLERSQREPEDPFQEQDSYPPSRPSLNFRGEGSLRVGTQTLIQALQAIPWAESEEGTNDREDSDENDADKPAFTLSSSIHTIHRPVARIHRQTTVAFAEEPEEESPVEEDEDDFDAQGTPLGEPRMVSGGTPQAETLPARELLRRASSMATIKVQRRAKLAEKLKDVFDVPEIEEVITGPSMSGKSISSTHSCLFVRRDAMLAFTILLQGYMYLTNSHICFFAHMPSRENQVLKSGSLSKKAQRTKRWNKHWFVLKNDALTWFHSSADPYFPHGVVDLRYAISCDPYGQKEMRIRTNQRTVHLEADSVPSRDEWVKSIRKVIFAAQNMGDSVKIAIPYSAVVDVLKSQAIDFSETIEIKVIDKEDSCFDSYFFAYFQSINHAVDQIRAAVKSGKRVLGGGVQDAVKDTTSHRMSTALPVIEPERSASAPASPPPTSSTLSSVKEKLSAPVGKLNSLLKSSHHHAFDSRAAPRLLVDVPPVAASPISDMEGVRPAVDHTYPPTLVHHSLSNASEVSAKSSWSVPVGVPGWIKNPSRFLFSSSPEVATNVAHVGDIHTSAHPSSADHIDFGFSIIDGVDSSAMDPLTVDKFRAAFALDEREALIAEIPGYLFRVLPVFGRINISSNYFCFRSSQPLTKTRMMIPIRDILATENAKAFRFGHHGLAVVIKGHEELFFEFNSIERRNACANLLEKLVEEFRERQRAGLAAPAKSDDRDSLLLETIKSRDSFDEEDDPRPPPEGRSEGLPAVMFTSVGSTFLTFKPQESLRFTCLTIGSRGDVQPYIALAKGLKADGHRACQDTDVLIESPSAMGGIHIAEALQIPYYRAFTMPWTRTRAYPHAFAVPETKMGGSYNYLTYVMFDQVFWRAISGQINRWRRQTLGIPATTMDKQEAHKVPFLYNFSPTMVPPPLDWYEWIRVTGYWFLEDSENSTAKKWEPPADLLEFINKARSEKKKLVYIGFGSIVVSDPDAMTKCVLDAVRESGVYAIMSKGWSDRLSSKKQDAQATEPGLPLPPEIFNIAAVPHDWLFQKVDAACHHGGAGTTGASVRAGIPTIIKPFFGDQFFWADRVEALGIGSGVRKLTVDNLASALISATTDAKQIARANAIGKAIRSENGVAKAVESIYRDLEYARSIIKRYAREPHPADETDIEWEVTQKSGEGSGRPLSEDWSFVDQAHLEATKEHSGALSSLKRVSVGLGGLSLHSKPTGQAPHVI